MASLAAQAESTSHSRILRLDEVMRRIGYGRSTVYRLGKAGILPQAERLDGFCSSAGWLEDDVDAFIESRRPAGKKPGMPARPVPTRATQTDTRCGSDAGVASSPVRMPAESGLADTSKPVTDLVPTTIRILGNVVYLHAPTGKLLMDVGRISPSLPGLKLDLSTIAALEDEAGESADICAGERRKQRRK